MTFPLARGFLLSGGTEALWAFCVSHFDDLKNQVKFTERKNPLGTPEGNPAPEKLRFYFGSFLHFPPPPRPHSQLVVRPPGTPRPRSGLRKLALKGAERKRGSRTGFRQKFPKDWATCVLGRGGARRGSWMAGSSAQLCCLPKAPLRSAVWRTLGASSTTERLPGLNWPLSRYPGMFGSIVSC